MVNMLYIETAPGFGGSPISLYNLLCLVDLKKINPFVVMNSINNEDVFKQRGVPKGITYNNMDIGSPWTHNPLGFLSKVMPHKYATALKYLYWKYIGVRNNTKTLVKFLKKNDIQVIHLNTGMGPTNFVYHAAAKLKIPIIVHLRGEPVLPYIDAKLNDGRDTTSVACRQPIHYIAVSEYIKKAHIDRYNIPEDKITVVYNGSFRPPPIATMDNLPSLKEQYGIKSDDFVFGSVGRLTEWKGLELLIEETAKAVKLNSNIKTMILGSGEPEYEKSLMDLATKMGVRDNIIFTGYVSDVNLYFRIFNVVVNTSIEPEPCSRTLVDGMSYAKPLLALRSGGNEELVTMNNGDIVTEDHKLHEFMLSYSRERLSGLMQSYGQGSSELYDRRHTVYQYVDGVEDVYKQLAVI